MEAWRPVSRSASTGHHTYLATSHRSSKAATTTGMLKPLSFKGDAPHKKKKRKRTEEPDSASIAPLGAGAGEDDEAWVAAEAASDLAGPVLLVLPPPQRSSSRESEPPSVTCVACDANGTVFASPLTNMDEDADPGVTAEPHDVRQVWVASRVAGTGDGVVSLKGHHGKYLSADRFGFLSANREAISFEEQFAFEPATSDAPANDATQLPPAAAGDAADETPTVAAVSIVIPGAFRVKTARDTYLAGVSVATGTSGSTLRADAEDVKGAAVVRVRMQARFKPREQAVKAATKAKERVSRLELERLVGRKLDDEQVKRLKRARKEGDWHEAVLDARVGGKHDKFAS